MNVAPTRAKGNALVSDMIVHEHEHILQCGLVCLVGGIVIANGHALHELEIVGHLKPGACQHVLVPIGNHSLVGLGMAHKPYRHARNDALFAADAIFGELRPHLIHLLGIEFCGCVDDGAELVFHLLDVATLFIGDRLQGDVGLYAVTLVHHQPVIFGFLVDERHLQVGRLLSWIHLDGGDEMVEKERALGVGGYYLDFVHAHFGFALHVALIAYPCAPPPFEVDAKGKRGAKFAVFEKLEGNGFARLGLLAVHPNDESREIVVPIALYFRLKPQVSFKAESRVGRVIPLQ